ncbi:MAG: UDP-N-acetylmuramate--L-alanine ligase [Aeromicrobium sp.]|uniref:UDP-N-acetylmuramate--L-alanine ligase n=1 Tax=Aeromicrobium sp. TaxID=1871063 RepID=UPI0039E5AC17
MHVPVPEVVEPAASLRHVHLVGIGGAGLSAIARLLHQQGVCVSGSDQADSALTRALCDEGITVHIGHRAENLGDADTVVVSTAVREDNPEVVAAQAAGVRLWPRSAGLQSILIGRRVIAVAGTHGKTTTTAMIVSGLRAAGLDPTFAIGAEVASLGTNARLGGDDLAVIEADESDGAFLVYTPDFGVVTNVDADHLDYWGSAQAYAEAFVRFVDGCAAGAAVGLDDEGARALVGRRRVVTTGFAEDADLRGTDLSADAAGTRFRVRCAGEADLPVELAVTGRHYAQDALLALAACRYVGADLDGFVRGLGEHRGAKRRMEYLGEAAGVQVYDSYAHHPTEIAADVAAARAIAGKRRLVVAFQPHLVSRTRIFGAEMGRELSAADEVVVADIYLAREDPDPRVSAQLVLDAVDGPAALAGGPVEGLDALLACIVRAGDLLVTLGAGDITAVGPRVLERLRADA